MSCIDMYRSDKFWSYIPFYEAANVNCQRARRITFNGTHCDLFPRVHRPKNSLCQWLTSQWVTFMYKAWQVNNPLWTISPRLTTTQKHPSDKPPWTPLEQHQRNTMTPRRNWYCSCQTTTHFRTTGLFQLTSWDKYCSILFPVRHRSCNYSLSELGPLLLIPIHIF